MCSASSFAATLWWKCTYVLHLTPVEIFLRLHFHQLFFVTPFEVSHRNKVDRNSYLWKKKTLSEIFTFLPVLMAFLEGQLLISCPAGRPERAHQFLRWKSLEDAFEPKEPFHCSAAPQELWLIFVHRYNFLDSLVFQRSSISQHEEMEPNCAVIGPKYTTKCNYRSFQTKQS